MNETLLRRTISVSVAAAVAWSPAVPAAAQFKAAVVRGAPAPVVSAVPVVLPTRSLTLSAPVLSAPGALSALPTAAPAPLVRSAIPIAAASPMASEAAVPRDSARSAGAEIAETPAAANLAGSEKADPRAAAAEDLGELSREVAASVQAVGPVAEATPDQAQGLGSRIMDLITGVFRKKDKTKHQPVTPGRVSALKKRLALNEAREEGAAAAPAASPEATRQAMLRTLDFVAGVFNAHYAPLDWKRETFGTQLAAEVEKARTAVMALQAPTTREFQDILARFVAALKDYHVGIQFYSTEASKLPLSIVGAGGKYYLAFVDREELPAEKFPFKAGDEVTSFDGRPVADVVAGLMRVKSEGGVEVTDRSMAERRLTRRIRQGGDDAPQGPVTIHLKRADGTEAAVTMEWSHVPELIPEIPVRDGGGLLEPSAPPAPSQPANADGDAVDQGWAASLKAALMKLVPSGLNPTASLFARRAPRERMNPYQIGGRESFVPELGEVLWKSAPRSPYHAYIFKAPDGRKVGYVRVASYEGDTRAAAKFGELMKKFEAETDALVVDQVNNPGGSLFYMYALLSRLSDKPLALPMQRIVVGEEDAYESVQTLMAAQQVASEEQLKQILGPALDGYRVTMRLWRSMVAYAQFVYTQLRGGKRLTDLVPFLGVAKLEQHPEERYTKPLMVLVNELDFSCADFFPAVLQDNKRAVIFGVRTAGAGGAVKAVQFPNQFGIAALAYTWTIALRANGKPIENLGVTPDEPYTPTAEDLQNGYAGYRRAVIEALTRMLGRAASAP